MFLRNTRALVDPRHQMANIIKDRSVNDCERINYKRLLSAVFAPPTPERQHSPLHIPRMRQCDTWAYLRGIAADEVTDERAPPEQRTSGGTVASSSDTQTRR